MDPLSSLVEAGTLRLERKQYGVGRVRVSTVFDGVGVCTDHQDALRKAGFHWSKPRERWAKCDIQGMPSLSLLITSGAVIGKIQRGDLWLSDGLVRVFDLRGILKKWHDCEWDQSSKTWRCEATRDHALAIREASRSDKPSNVSHVSQLQREVEEAMGARIGTWPPHFAKAAKAARIGYKAERHDSGVGRMGFTRFCLHNGCGSELYVEWLRDRGCIKADAWSEIKSVIAKLTRGDNCGKTWDLSKRSKVDARMTDVVGAKGTVEQLATVAEGRGDARSAAPPWYAAYYEGVFPYVEVAMLLHRQGSPFQLRTIAYRQLDGKRALQSRPVLDLGALRRLVDKYGATSLHAGSAYSEESQTQRLEGSLGTELVLEIDDVPIEIDHARRWEWLRHALEVTVAVLGEWFGLSRLFCFASGNRGPHVWVRDDAALEQTLAERKRIFERLQRPREEPRWRELADRLLLPFYTRWHSEGGTRPTDERLVEFAFPTFDAAVALQPEHLHRLPFSIHEQTGRVAIPFEPTPPFAGMPEKVEDMPRADDTDLKGALAAPLKALRSALGDATERDVEAVVAEKRGSEWHVKRERKRKQRSGEADLPVAPLRIDRNAAAVWASALRLAANASGVSGIGDAGVRSIAARSDGDGKDWRARLRNEADKVDQLLRAVGEQGLLRGETYTNGDGRTLTHYPQLEQSQFVQGLAKPTRHAVTSHKYAEVDLSTAHVAAAWGACERHYGTEGAESNCPHLRIAATNKQEARERVRSQNPRWSEGRCKRAILATLNQEPDDGIRRCSFLDGLVKERAHIAAALRVHPAIAGSPLESINRKCVAHAKPAVREFSLMLQTLEGAIVRSAVRTLATHGFETAAFIADGLLVRPAHSPFSGDKVNAALASALSAVSDGVREALGVGVVMECEHAIRM